MRLTPLHATIVEDSVEPGQADAMLAADRPDSHPGEVVADRCGLVDRA